MKTLLSGKQQFKERKVTVNKTILLLAKNNITINEEEAAVILNFLYLMASYNGKSNAFVGV